MQDAKLASIPNAIEQIEQLARKPFLLETAGLIAAVPEGYDLKDLEKHLSAPLRHKGETAQHDVESFIEQVKRYATDSTAIYVNADYAAQKVSATAVFNDHASFEPGWRDHRATFTPRLTQEWLRWTQASGKKMTQADFGYFLEANVADIAEPAGGEVLEFVLNLQETRSVKYGSAMNLANGMVQINFVEEGDSATRGKLELFRKFTLGLRPFAGSQAYSIEALLRYRIDRNSGAIEFWFDIQRPDRVLEDACRETVKTIRDESGVPLLFGTP